jgi:hypothetical protein
MAWVAAVAAVISAVSAISQSEAQARQQESAADAARYNANLANQEADATLQASSANEDAQRRKSAQQMGQQVAGMAENGIGLDSGTATDLTEQSAMNAELDALNIRYEGQSRARALKAGATLDKWNADNQTGSAGTTRTGGFLNAGASALSTYGNYSGMKARAKLTD